MCVCSIFYGPTWVVSKVYVCAAFDPTVCVLDVCVCVCVWASCSFNERWRCTNEATVAAGRRFGVWEETQVGELYGLHLFITLIDNTPRAESSLRHLCRPRTCSTASKNPPSYLQINTYGPSAASLWSCLSCVVASAASASSSPNFCSVAASSGNFRISDVWIYIFLVTITFF